MSFSDMNIYKGQPMRSQNPPCSNSREPTVVQSTAQQEPDASQCATASVRISRETFLFGQSEEAGDPGPIRTADLQFRKLLLYPSELRGQVKKRSLLTG